ncbi:MAG: carbon-nitrogen hydrolase family protein [Rhodospirillales bacterium]|jgi:nitrilase|nr:carbon-nitrogen hydrolase family protein [Rhodospirillales bacterium]MDP6883166.1 carbon-nitrogen hydrolase family protein [Rhodospirillales bacterium]
MKVSLIQMNSQENKDANLKKAEQLIAQAVADDHPDMVVLPEMFTCLTESAEVRSANADKIPGGETYGLLRDLAQRHRIFVHGGSLLESDGDDVYNTTVAFDAKGNELARYRKIHLFDVTTPDGKEYRESASISRGGDVVTYDAAGARVGCTICYDLRFPELYQALARKDATVIMVPAAFTLMTGKDHWEVLLRARAIETESYVLAPGQCGTYANGRRATYGHSLVVDPWGHVVAKASDQVGYITVRLDLDYLQSVRAKIPVAQHKVL